MDKKKKTCCFTGSRDCNLSFNYMYNVVLDLCSKGFLYFGVGGAVGFDTLAAKCVLTAKSVNPEIKLIVVAPFLGQEKYFSSKQKKEYYEIVKKADKVVYVEEKYSKSAYLHRNRHMVFCSSLCVAFCPRCSGGAFYTVQYAKAVGVSVRFV